MPQSSIGTAFSMVVTGLLLASATFCLLFLCGQWRRRRLGLPHLPPENLGPFWLVLGFGALLGGFGLAVQLGLEPKGKLVMALVSIGLGGLVFSASRFMRIILKA